ncbi:hypothetical protein MSAN_00729400 [Mycena sanguinolenta]|uniref:Uncharacterized protein n=1 Tax=Mycena sanguinolenta TaxID=230812 RepID=A0A8H6Z5J9_9AGAR|nr:hypothetical protein MSAN_00729400 [Mycena sanguinolenta]
MPTADEVKQLEGVSAAQHRFRLAVNAPEDNGSSSNAIPNPPRPPTDQGNNTPFLYGQLPFRNSRYKEKFQALREKYDRVILKQQEYQQDLDLATAKIKKLQAENDLLLDAMNLAAAHQPSLFGLIPPSHTPPDMPPGGGSMDHDGFSGPSAGPMHAAERPPPRHMNGNGSSNGTSSSSSGHGPPDERP